MGLAPIILNITLQATPALASTGPVVTELVSVSKVSAVAAC